MNGLTKSISQVVKGAAKAFYTFPASVACAGGFALVTIVRIHLEWPEQEAFNFLFGCLHWAFALGAVFGLAAVTGAQSRGRHAKDFLIANLATGGVTAAAFGLLLAFGQRIPMETYARVTRMSEMAIARMGVAVFISLMAFIWLAGYPKEKSDFSRAFFMTHKAFFIALLYGLVLMGGTSGVAGAFQALLYRDMSSKVYMYLATLSGFTAFCVFAGYFPSFKKGEEDPHRDHSHCADGGFAALDGQNRVNRRLARFYAAFGHCGLVRFWRRLAAHDGDPLRHRGSALLPPRLPHCRACDFGL
jgi:hypothetical protein